MFRSLIDNVPVSIYAKRADLKLFYVNKGWCDLTGFSKDEAIGKTDAEIFGPDGEAFMDGDRAVLRTGDDPGDRGDGDCAGRLAPPPVRAQGRDDRRPTARSI